MLKLKVLVIIAYMVYYIFLIIHGDFECGQCVTIDQKMNLVNGYRRS